MIQIWQKKQTKAAARAGVPRCAASLRIADVSVCARVVRVCALRIKPTLLNDKCLRYTAKYAQVGKFYTRGRQTFVGNQQLIVHR